MAQRKKSDHLVDRLATRIGGEVERLSDTVSERIGAELLDDNVSLSEPVFRDWWRGHWSDPQWRQAQLEKMGDTAFAEATFRAFGVPEPAPLSRLARDGAPAAQAAQAAAPDQANGMARGMASDALARVQAPRPEAMREQEDY